MPGDFVWFSPSLTYVTSSEQSSKNLEQRYVYLHDQKHPLTESYDRARRLIKSRRGGLAKTKPNFT